MKIRMALIAGGVALTAAAAIPAAGAFACPSVSPHCQKVLAGGALAFNNTDSQAAHNAITTAIPTYFMLKCA